jgi:hypothetical protein
MTQSATRTQRPGTRCNFTHFAETLDYHHRAVSCQLKDSVLLGLIDRRFRDEVAGIGICIFELLRIGEGEHDA